MCHYLSVVMFCEHKKLITQQILILSICSSFPFSRRLSLYWNGKFFIHPQCFKENDLSPCLKQLKCKRTQYFLMINQCSLYLSSLCRKFGRKKWQPIPVFLPRASHGQRSLVGCCPQGRTESDTTEATQNACTHWRRKLQPTPVYLPGESQERRSLVGCRLWGTQSRT